MPRTDHFEADAPIFVSKRTMANHRTVGAPVTHTFAVVGFYTGGRARFEQRGEWLLRAGDAIVVPAGEPHRIVESKSPELWGLRFCVPCFAAEDSGRLLEPFERVRAGASPVVRIPAARRPFLESLFRELEAASNAGHASQARRSAAGPPDAVQRSLLTLVLNEIRRAARWDEAPENPKSVVTDSLRFIERNCLRPLTLKEVAKAVGRSPAYVTTALTRATGRSAVEWIISGRMAEARRLLLHSTDAIDVVAERVGYADPTHFIRMFQRAHGITPAAWRAMQSHGHPAHSPAPSPARD